MSEPTVSVRGAVVAEVDPELVRFTITVIAQGRDRATTLADLNSRHKEILSAIAGYQTEKVESARLSIRPEFKDGKPREKVTGYNGSVRVMVTLTDFTVLGEMVGRLAGYEWGSLEGPWWSLRPDSPAYRETRTAAVHDAVDAARGYAAAMGSTLTGLIELADPGLEMERGLDWMAQSQGLGSRAGKGRSEEPVELDLEPIRQSIRGSVVARFTMAQPGSDAWA